MGIVRANDPKANDTRHVLLTCLGKLTDMGISTETKRVQIDKLTELLKGRQMTIQTFQEYGLTAKLDTNEKSGIMSLTIHVPKEYVVSSISEDRDKQYVTFAVNQVTHTSNHGSDAVELSGLDA